MDALSWRSSLIVRGLAVRTARPAPVAVGLVDTAAGGVQVALRVGDDPPVILALQDAQQLALNLNETTAERLRVTAEALGEEQP